MVTTPTFIAQAERAAYLAYDRQRRLHLAGRIGLLFFPLAVFLAPIITFYTLSLHLARLQSLIVYTNDGIIGICTALFGIGWLAARQGKVELATLSVVGGLGAAIVTFQVTWAVTRGIDPVLLIDTGSLGLVIVLAGMLGNRLAIFATTAGANVFAIALGLLAPRSVIPNMVTDPEIVLFIPALLCIQWAFAVVALTSQSAALRTLRELGEAQIAVEHARKLDDLKDQFISSVNHELRNPIMAMMNYIAVLTRRHEMMTPARRTEILLALEQAGRRVSKLVSSVLNVRITAQSARDFTPQAIPLAAALQAAAELVDPSEAKMMERDLFLHLSPTLAVWGEETYIQQILTNLLSNAAKYSPPGTPIEVEAHEYDLEGSAKASAPRMTIMVRDHGLGIPPEQLPLLFNRFVRLPRDLASRTYGNGLGLYLCKVLTEAMDGRIWAESSGVEGEGTTIHLDLPTPPLPSESSHRDSRFTIRQRVKH